MPDQRSGNNVLVIPPVSNNVLEIPSLADLLKKHGVPTAEQEALSSDTATDDLIKRYIEDPLNRRNHPMAAYVAGNEARLFPLLLSLALGIGRQPELPEVPVQPGRPTTPFPPSPPTDLPTARSGMTTVPLHADYMGSTAPLRANQVPEIPRSFRVGPIEAEDYAELERALQPEENMTPAGRNATRTPDEIEDMLQRLRAVSQSTFGGRPGTMADQPPMGFEPTPGRYANEPNMDFGPTPPYRTDRGPMGDVLLGDDTERRYHWSMHRDYPHPQAPTRSLPPYDEYPRYWGSPTQRLRQSWGGGGTQDLHYEGTGHPTGMLDTPTEIEFGEYTGHAAQMGRHYNEEADLKIPRKKVRPGLVSHYNPRNNEWIFVYYGPDKKPIASAEAWVSQYDKDAGIHVKHFGADLDKGALSAKGATQIGEALIRMVPHPGSMSQYSRQMFTHIVESMRNPKLRDVYMKRFKKTRMMLPEDIQFPGQKLPEPKK